MSHIALLLPDLEIGGAQRVMLSLAGSVAELGHRVDLLILRNRGGLKERVPAAARRVDLNAWHPSLGHSGMLALGAYRLRKWIETERPDVVLSTITGANLAAALALTSIEPRPRLVLREAVTLANVTSIARLYAMKLLYKRADAIIVLSDHMRAELENRLSVPENKLHCIPNWVDREGLMLRATEDLLHPWLDDPGVQTLVSVGRLIPQKDHATLIKALSQLCPSLNARLLIVGEGPEGPALNDLAASLGVQSKVELIGGEANPWRWMVRSDLFVLSSRWEGSPNALLEALALGVPAVISEYDSSAAHIARTHGLDAVPPADPRMLADAIENNLRHPKTPASDIVRSRQDGLPAYLRLLGIAS